MRIIIHAGMHKTGSSAIQSYFHENDLHDITYAQCSKGGNHSSLFVLLFQNIELLEKYHGFRRRGSKYCSELPEIRQRRLKDLEGDLQASREKTFVFSGEDISHPSFQYAVTQMRDFFRKWTDDITIVAYVRRPLSFATSAFQQKLRGADLKALRMQTLWPAYKARFAHLDEIFGRDRVILKLYDRASLIGGDVVHDFASLLGVELTDPPKAEANTSLSAEATALLYTQRRLGSGFGAGFDKANAANTAFINALRSIGTSKLTFADSLWAPVLEQNRADLDWMEERLGVPLRDTPTPGALEIAGEEDLFRLAIAHQPALEAALLDAVRNDTASPQARTVRTLELLRQLRYAPFTTP